MTCLQPRATALLRAVQPSPRSSFQSGIILRGRLPTAQLQLQPSAFGPSLGTWEAISSRTFHRSKAYLTLIRSSTHREGNVTLSDPEPERLPAGTAMGASSSTTADFPTARGTELPALSGPYQVSVADVEADIDNATIVRLYYPCDDEVPPCESYWLPSWHYAKGYGDYARLPALLSVPAMMLAAGSARIPCADNRPLAVTQRGWQPDEQAGDSTDSTDMEPTTIPCESPPQFPVVLFSHGLAGMRTTYSSVCADFASHGYVVAAVEHRDGSACVTYREGEKIPHQHVTKESEAKDGSLSFRQSQLQQRVKEMDAACELLRRLNSGNDLGCTFTGAQGGQQLQQAESFQGRLEANNPIVVGHSFGGATALATCCWDRQGRGDAGAQRFAACILLDSWLFAFSKEDIAKLGRSPRRPPVLFVNNEKFQWESNLVKMTDFVRTAFEAPNATQQDGSNKPTSGPQSHQTSAIVTMLEAGHMSPSDCPVICGRLLSLMGFKPQVPPPLSLQLNWRVSHSFLSHVNCGPYALSNAPVDQWFNGQPTDSLPPEMQLEESNPLASVPQNPAATAA